MKGHPILGAFSGLIFGISLAGLLLTTGTLATDSIGHLVLPIAGLLLGILIAAIAPFKRSRLQTAPAAAAAAGPAPLADPPVAPPPAAGGGRLHADPPPADDPPAEGS